MDKILIVDSSEKNIEAMAKYLYKNGLSVMSMSDGTGVQIKVKISLPDLIIIDANLKSSSGFDICKQLKRDEDAIYIPVLMITDNDGTNAKKRAVEANADDYLPRGFDGPALVSKVHSLLRIKHLSNQLKRQYNEIEEKNKVLDMQLKMARQVQRSLIQEQDFVHNDVRFVSKYMPALDIGGDFYDILKLDDNNVGVVIGDVSGHGISAALFTAMLNMMIRNLAPRYFNPSQFLYHMNNEFINIFQNKTSDMYACVFYAVIDTMRKRIYYSNAGQALPLYVSVRNGTAVELDASGMPVGMMKDAVYEQKITIFEPEDMLLFYTDGLADNLYKDSSEEFYTRLTAILLDPALNSNPEKLIDSLINVFYKDDLTDNMKLEMDDMSLIVCKM